MSLATVDFPTPPFCDTTAITSAILSLFLGRGEGIATKQETCQARFVLDRFLAFCPFTPFPCIVLLRYPILGPSSRIRAGERVLTLGRRGRLRCTVWGDYPPPWGDRVH